MTKKHLSIHVKGSVQGVFFRASAMDHAKSSGLTGFVRNEPDGSVYIEAEGNEDQLNEFVSWCRIGPPSAKVESCIVTEGRLLHFTRFEIQR